MKAQRVSTTADYRQLLRMIGADRAGLTFLPQEEAVYYLSTPEFSSGDLVMVRFKELPPGEKRYLYCSKSVPVSVMANINRQLRAPR